LKLWMERHLTPWLYLWLWFAFCYS